jgi:hypothetical protein
MGAKFRLEDLPPHVLARIRPEDRAALGLTAPAVALSEPRTGDGKGQAEKRDVARRRPNKTEAKYAAEVLRGTDARYEALTFRLANGHRYTPDWVVFDGGRPSQCHEVKGSYKFGSHQRARLAFDQAATEFPGLNWFWATLTKKGWEQKHA